MIEKLKASHPKIYKHFFTVTTFSKLVALSMFIIFPFIGFYLGMKYQQRITAPVPVVLEAQGVAIPTPTPSTTASWKTYINKQYNFSIDYPNDWILTPNNINEGAYQEIYITNNKSNGLTSTIYLLLPGNPDNKDKPATNKTEVINFGNQPALFKYSDPIVTWGIHAYSYDSSRQPFNLIEFSLGDDKSAQDKDLAIIKKIFSTFKLKQ